MMPRHHLMTKQTATVYIQHVVAKTKVKTDLKSSNAVGSKCTVFSLA